MQDRANGGHVFQQMPGEHVPDARLLLLRLRVFMGLKTWAEFNRKIGGHPVADNIYLWVHLDEGRRTTPGIKNLIKITAATLDAALERERELVERVEVLEARIADKSIPCDVCPLGNLRLPQQLSERPKLPVREHLFSD